MEGHFENGIKINPISTVYIHESVKTRWKQGKEYIPENLEEYVKKNGWVLSTHNN